MIFTAFVPVLLCSLYCSAQPPPIRHRIPNDKRSWANLWKSLKKNGLSRTDDPRLNVFDTIVRVNAKARGTGTARSDSNVFLFEGDINMPRGEVIKLVNQGSQGTSRQRRAVIRKSRTNLWRPNIAYALDGRLNSRARTVIESAVREWQATLPCMGTWRDVTRTSKPRDYMYFFQGGGCYSQVGRVGGAQRVSIGRGCEHHGIAVHEIGHAMGLWHEQSRPDRDSYVRILWNNIIPAMRFNFQKHSTTRVNSLGVPYDYASVMHYGATAFARARGLRTIQNIRNNLPLGQRRGLSSSDKKQVQLLYGCTTTTTTKPSGCKDSVSHRNWCSESRKLGLCGNSLFKNYMTTHCCSTCKQTTKPSGCSNVAAAETCNKYKSHCKPGFRWKNWMDKNCCKTCQSIVAKNCSDKNQNCAAWKRKGYCQHSYVDYMKKNCAKSCGCPI